MPYTRNVIADSVNQAWFPALYSRCVVPSYARGTLNSPRLAGGWHSAAQSNIVTTTAESKPNTLLSPERGRIAADSTVPATKKRNNVIPAAESRHLQLLWTRAELHRLCLAAGLR